MKATGYIPTKASQRLQQIFITHKGNTKFPSSDNWKELDNNKLWRAVFMQVCVVGNSRGLGRLSEQLLKKSSNYTSLNEMTPAQRKKTIHSLLTNHGVRYASQSISKCRKTKALNSNLQTIINKKGPKAYFKRISTIPEEKLRVKTIAGDMAFIKNKGARDLLMELGLVIDAIALDTRVLNILKECGIAVPKDAALDSYASLEAEIIEKVCKPIGVTGMELDRVLYQNYDQIMISFD